mmetsp:Transcript_15324/g.44339  ORF Transcript_15324/g.44339 Transcript_15324/m.44339 type:complete len:229 (+) Transcript_15324:197-883(+)
MLHVFTAIILLSCSRYSRCFRSAASLPTSLLLNIPQNKALRIFCPPPPPTTRTLGSSPFHTPPPTQQLFLACRRRTRKSRLLSHIQRILLELHSNLDPFQKYHSLFWRRAESFGKVVGRYATLIAPRGQQARYLVGLLIQAILETNPVKLGLVKTVRVGAFLISLGGFARLLVTFPILNLMLSRAVIYGFAIIAPLRRRLGADGTLVGRCHDDASLLSGWFLPPLCGA